MRILCCLLVLVSLVTLATVLTGCGRKVSVVDPNTAIHLSGMWNDADSKNVSAKMIDQCTGGGWITNFRDRAGRAPILRVSQIVNKSNEDIATEVFTNDLERALINGGKVRVVASRSEAELNRDERGDIQGNSAKESAPVSGQEQAPDFALQGSVRIQHDAAGSTQVKFYQVDLKLIDLTTNETVWIGTDEVKKVVEK